MPIRDTQPLLLRKQLQAESRLDRWIRNCRDGIFGVLFTMAKEGGHSSHNTLSVVAMVWDFLQLLAYPLYPGKYFPWANMRNMSWLLTVLKFANPSNAADTVSPALKLTLLFFACAWSAATISVAIWAARSFVTGHFASVAPLKFLRATAKLTASALFVPCVSLFASTYKCSAGGTWGATDWPCYGGAHLALLSVVSVLLISFWGFTLTISAVFFERDYGSDALTARPHGRVAIIMISIKSECRQKV